jgi:hypothetical protein
MTDLEALAARVEQATGRDDRLALEVARATGTVINAAPIGADGKGIEHFPDYTASVDAALTLVPEGWTAWELRSRWGLHGFSADISRLNKETGEDVERATAKTPALAITAAALRAHAAQVRS